MKPISFIFFGAGYIASGVMDDVVEFYGTDGVLKVDMNFTNQTKKGLLMWDQLTIK